MKALAGNKRERRLRVATWNFSGLGSERKQKEVEELLVRNNIDFVAGQESWEREDTRIEVEGYKWFGKPHNNQTSQRGEGGVGFLVRECLVSEVEFITSVRYEESVWMKVRGRGGDQHCTLDVCICLLIVQALLLWKAVMGGLKKMYLVLEKRVR